MRWTDRRSAASLLQRTGAIYALEKLPRERGLLVLNYHRVGEPAGNPFDDATFSATADAFSAQMSYLKGRFAMPAAQEAVALLERGRFDDPTAVVTFDDGYRDNYSTAFPILRELGLSACFFIVTGLLDAPALPWWDRVAYCIKQTQVETLTIDYPTRLHFDLRAVDRRQVIWRILRAYKDASALDQERFFDELEQRARVPVQAGRLGRELFMTWQHAREMANAGMAIGSHTVTHPVLAALPEASQRRELVESRERIGEMAGRAPDLLAYPVGGPAAFSDTTKRLAREAGYRAAFSYFGGLNRAASIDRFAVGRLAVEHEQTFAQFRLRVMLAAIGRSVT